MQAVSAVTAGEVVAMDGKPVLSWSKGRSEGPLTAPIADIAYQNKAVVYDLLFQTTAETLRTLAADPKHPEARIGFTAVLHTLGSAMTHHPHLHCIVPGGGLSPDGTQWIPCRPGSFLPVRVLSSLFRRLFLEHLNAAYRAGQLAFFGHLQHLSNIGAFATFINPLRQTEWVVYAKRPFRGPTPSWLIFLAIPIGSPWLIAGSSPTMRTV
jgi:hypothetical protein